LRDQDDLGPHLDYTRFNPVKRRRAVQARDWPYSSFRRWVRLGTFREARAGDAADARTFGER
jgi:REP-associated tyrosine transposase